MGDSQGQHRKDHPESAVWMRPGGRLGPAWCEQRAQEEEVLWEFAGAGGRALWGILRAKAWPEGPMRS